MHFPLLTASLDITHQRFSRLSPRSFLDDGDYRPNGVQSVWALSYHANGPLRQV